MCIDFIKKQDVIYIGESENLQDQFVKYVDSNFENDACKQKTNTYQRMFVENQQECKTLHVFQVYHNIDYTLHNFQLHL